MSADRVILNEFKAHKGRRRVLHQPSRYLLVLAMTSMLGLAPARMLAQAQAPSSQEPQKNWKDRAEYDLYDAITKDTNPKTRLDKLQQWVKQYPKTDYIQQRRTLLLTTYFALNQAKEAVGVAKQILADDPKNFTALYIIVNYTIPLAGNPPSADVMDQGEKAANTLLSSSKRLQRISRPINGRRSGRKWKSWPIPPLAGWRCRRRTGLPPRTNFKRP